MKISFLTILALFFVGCQTPKKDYDFVFYKWNIRESYCLKINSSDTLYFVNNYPFDKQNLYTILKPDEKEKIEQILDSLTFPKEENFESDVNDGVTFAFFLSKNKEHKKIRIHSHSGPEQFWYFGELLENIKNQNKFSKLGKQIVLGDIDKTLFIPIPPTFKK